MTEESDRIARAYRGYAETGAAEQRWSLLNPGNQAGLRERQARTRRLFAEAGWLPLQGRKVLEVGSGGGAELAALIDFGARPEDLVGVDLLAERVAQARQRHPDLDFRHGNAEKLDFASESFDLVLALTLFSSIKDPVMARRVADEIHRVLRPGGALLWYDFRYDNPRNPAVRGLGESAVRDLFPRLAGNLTTLTLLPPLARRLGPLTGVLYGPLAAVAPLRTHHLGLLFKEAR